MSAGMEKIMTKVTCVKCNKEMTFYRDETTDLYRCDQCGYEYIHSQMQMVEGKKKEMVWNKGDSDILDEMINSSYFPSDITKKWLEENAHNLFHVVGYMMLACVQPLLNKLEALAEGMTMNYIENIELGRDWMSDDEHWYHEIERAEYIYKLIGLDPDTEIQSIRKYLKEQYNIESDEDEE